MKRMNSVVVCVMAVAAMMLASAMPSVAGQSGGWRSDGLLRMKHSPVLGINVPIAVWIDGIQAGVFAKGHVYERYLTPGRHSVYASRPGRLFDSFYGTLDVQPGGTYSFVVKCTPHKVILQPVGRID